MHRSHDVIARRTHTYLSSEALCLVYTYMTWMVWSSPVAPSGECLHISHALYGAYAVITSSRAAVVWRPISPEPLRISA